MTRKNEVTRITRDNVANYPVGTQLMCNFGAFSPTVEALVVDYRYTPASKWFEEKVELVIETEDGNEHFTSQLVNYGIGIYLLDEFMYGGSR